MRTNLTKILLFIFPLFWGFISKAQSFEGVITYSIRYDDLLPDMKGYEEMMPKTSTLFISGKVSKSITANPSGGEPTVFLTQNETGEMLQLREALGKKYAILIRANQEDQDIDFVDTDEEKVIAGYSCKLAKAKTNDINLSVCYTKQLPTIKNQKVKGVDGFLLEIVMEMEEVTMTQTVSSIRKEKVEKLKFEAPSGYHEISLKEFKQLVSGADM